MPGRWPRNKSQQNFLSDIQGSVWLRFSSIVSICVAVKANRSWNSVRLQREEQKEADKQKQQGTWRYCNKSCHQRIVRKNDLYFLSNYQVNSSLKGSFLVFLVFPFRKFII